MTDHPTSLYTAWFGLLPQMFRTMMPPPDAGAAGEDGAAPAKPAPASLPFPADQIAVALQGLDTVLTQLYHAYLPLLAQGPLAVGPIRALADGAAGTFSRLLQGFGGAGIAQAAAPAWTGLAQAVEPWASLARGLLPPEQRGADGDALRAGVERAFGGLGDAFGLGPVRELEQAWRDALHAGVERQRAQADYLGLVAEAWSEGTRGLLEQLAAMGARGDRVESLLGFVRMWAQAVDGPMHDAMQGERGLAATTQLMRATTRHREQLQRAVALACEALHLPTRADVDEAYREIQQLKRELRRLRKSLPQPARAPARERDETAEEQRA